MPLTTATGDLFNGTETIIAHGCNAQGEMRRGFAAHIMKRFPDAFALYRDEYETRGLKTGSILVWNGPSTTVINCITQDRYGRGKQFICYDALTSCMREIERMAKNEIGPFAYDRRIAMPFIGADRGGGDWHIISQIIDTELRSVDAVAYSLAPVATPAYR